jgi:hypothetical protein
MTEILKFDRVDYFERCQESLRKVEERKKKCEEGRRKRLDKKIKKMSAREQQKELQQELEIELEEEEERKIKIKEIKENLSDNRSEYERKKKEPKTTFLQLFKNIFSFRQGKITSKYTDGEYALGYQKQQLEMFSLLSSHAPNILLFITRNSKKLGASVYPDDFLDGLINSQYWHKKDDQDNYIMNYVALFNHEEIEFKSVLFNNRFQSLNLFLFFLHKLDSSHTGAHVSGDDNVYDKTLLEEIARGQTNLQVVKWLIDHGIDVRSFLCYDYNSSYIRDDLVSKDIIDQYLKEENIETLVFLINQHHRQQQHQDHQNRDRDRDAKTIDYSYLKQELFKDYQLLVRMFVRGINFDKIPTFVTNRQSEPAKKMEKLASEKLQLLTSILDNYFPPPLSKIILLSF